MPINQILLQATTIPQAIINESNLLTNVTSLPQLLSYTLILPYFSLFIVFIAIGIPFVRTKRIDISFLSGFMISLIFYLFSPNFISVGIVAFLGFVVALSVLYEVFVGRKGNKILHNVAKGE